MCVIVYKPKKATITKRVLRQCWDANPDSVGFMFAVDGELIIQKGYISFRTFYKDYRKQENIHNENFVLHFRIATHGKINETNCHPFVVNKNIGFVHNGILNCVHATKSKSDTSVFCTQVLKKLPINFLNRTEYRVLLESVCKAESSKFAFLNNRGTVHIFNESAGVWQGGCWFSNTHFEPGYELDKNWRYKPAHSLGHNVVDDYVECVWCSDYFPANEDIKSYEPCCEACAAELEQDKYPTTEQKWMKY